MIEQKITACNQVFYAKKINCGNKISLEIYNVIIMGIIHKTWYWLFSEDRRNTGLVTYM